MQKGYFGHGGGGGGCGALQFKKNIFYKLNSKKTEFSTHILIGTCPMRKTLFG